MKKLLLITLFLTASLSTMVRFREAFDKKQKSNKKPLLLTGDALLRQKQWEQQKDVCICALFAVLGVATLSTSCYFSGIFSQEIQ